MDRGKDWSHADTSQGLPGATKRWKWPGKIRAPTSKSLQREHDPWPLNRLVSAFRPPEL